MCCEAGLTLDVCGVCGGNAVLVDISGACCDVNVTDAAGLCCTSASGVDDCGLCGGDGSSCVKIVSLVYAVRSIDGLDNETSPQYIIFVDDFVASMAVTLGVQEDHVIMLKLTPTSRHHRHLLQLMSVGVQFKIEANDALTPSLSIADIQSALDNTKANSGQVLEVISIVPSGICSNGLCEVGEQCSLVNDTLCCLEDCPLILSTCPPGGGFKECNGQGLCNRTSSTCNCFYGFEGTSCGSAKPVQGDDFANSSTPIDASPPVVSTLDSPVSSPPLLPPSSSTSPPSVMLPPQLASPSQESSMVREAWFLVVIIGGVLMLLIPVTIIVRHRRKLQRVYHYGPSTGVDPKHN